MVVTSAKHSRTVRIFSTSAEVEREVARRFVALAREKTESQQSFHVAWSRGVAPHAIWARLVREFREQLDWSRVHFYSVDERCDPPTRAPSDVGTAMQPLMEPMGVRLGGIHSLARELDPDAAASHYERRLDDLPKSSRGLPTLDLVVLGLGNDGHTASLFPKVDCVSKDAPRGWVTHVTHVKSSIGQRLSLTLEILNNARHALFVVVGLEKAKALQLALTTETRSVPASLVRLVNGSVEWYVDKGACVALEADRWLAGVP